MKAFRIFALIFTVCGALRSLGAELPIEQPDRYTNFSITLRLTDNVRHAQDQAMYIHLPARPDPSVQSGGQIQLSQNGRGQPPEVLGDRQSQALFKALKAALADYVLAPSTSKQPADALMLIVNVSAGENAATFTFVKHHPPQWKKAAEIWNAARATLQPSQIGTVPSL